MPQWLMAHVHGSKWFKTSSGVACSLQRAILDVFQPLERDYHPLIAPSVAIGTYRTMAAGENVLAEADDARLDCPGG